MDDACVAMGHLRLENWWRNCARVRASVRERACARVDRGRHLTQAASLCVVRGVLMGVVLRVCMCVRARARV